MKKIKKILAAVMTLAMVLGMSMTTFAAVTTVDNIVSDITVAGLSDDVDTDINMYRFATLKYDDQTNEYFWEIAGWADEYVTLNADGTAYEIARENEALLKEAAQSQSPYRTQPDIAGTSYTFENVPIGGYVIIPSDDNADYSPLFAVNTYNRTLTPSEEGKPVAENITVYAKSERHTITKEQTDGFAQIGQKVTYTIKATFPMSEDSEGNTLQSFVITDTPTGLNIDNDSVNVTLNSVDVTDQTIHSVDPGTGILTVNFANLLDDDVKYDGRAIVITYNAVVTDVEYNNSASATSDTTDYDSGSVTGATGSIELTKVDAEHNEKVLLGAEFRVYDLGENGTWNPQDPGTPMSLIYDSDLGAYRPVLDGETGVTTISTKETADTDDGVLKVVGLDEGKYHFEEVKAPDGYSINENGYDILIASDETTTKTLTFEDTKLASLPSTGGIGTTIFTVGGCIIMIAAAGLFFASRRKSSK